MRRGRLDHPGWLGLCTILLVLLPLAASSLVVRAYYSDEVSWQDPILDWSFLALWVVPAGPLIYYFRVLRRLLNSGWQAAGVALAGFAGPAVGAFLIAPPGALTAGLGGALLLVYALVQALIDARLLGRSGRLPVVAFTLLRGGAFILGATALYAIALTGSRIADLEFLQDEWEAYIVPASAAGIMAVAWIITALHNRRVARAAAALLVHREVEAPTAAPTEP